MRSSGSVIDVIRKPKLSSITTTSPCATSLPLAYNSTGSPATLSSSIIEPRVSSKTFFIGNSQRPNSTAN